MKRSFILGFQAMITTLTACVALQSGSPVVRYDHGAEPRMTEAPVSGTYALYSSVDATPQTTVPLEKGDRIGFRRDERSGRIVAIAGDKDPVKVDEAYDHYWRRQ